MYERKVDLNEVFPPESHKKKPCGKCQNCTCKKDMTNEEIIEKVSGKMIDALGEN